MTLPTDYDERKAIPLLTGVIDYFLDALAEVAKVSAAGNAQHNPEAHAAGVMYWNRAKSQDEVNTMIRHASERGGFDTDGMRHSAKAAWRALANLQKELEAAYGFPPPRGCIAPELRGAQPAQPAQPEEYWHDDHECGLHCLWPERCTPELRAAVRCAHGALPADDCAYCLAFESEPAPTPAP